MPKSKKPVSLAGENEKKAQRKQARTTTTVTKENTQKPRSKLDIHGAKDRWAPASKSKKYKRIEAGKTAGRKMESGRGTEISNKTLEKRTKADLKATLKARAKDEAAAAAKKSAKKAAVKTVGKIAARAIPGVGAALVAYDVLDAVATKRKSGKGQMRSKKKGK